MAFTPPDPFTTEWVPIWNNIVGEWQNIPFNATKFTALAPMTWTVASGNVLTNAYSLIGKTMFWSLFIAGSTIGGSLSTTLKVIAPFPFSSRTMLFRAARASINGINTEVEVFGSGTELNIIMNNDATFPALGTFRIDFSGFFEIL